MADIFSPIGDTEGMSRLTAKGANIEAQIPLGRQGKRGMSYFSLPILMRADRFLEDIANMAVYLFSPAANWITGSVMVRFFLPTPLNEELIEPGGRRW